MRNFPRNWTPSLAVRPGRSPIGNKEVRRRRLRRSVAALVIGTATAAHAVPTNLHGWHGQRLLHHQLLLKWHRPASDLRQVQWANPQAGSYGSAYVNWAPVRGVSSAWVPGGVNTGVGT